MTLIQLRLDRDKARSSKDQIKYNVLTTLLGEVENELKKDLHKSAEPVLIQTVLQFIKNIKLTLSYSPNPILEKELEILQAYLPVPLTNEDIKTIISEVFKEEDKTSKSYKGKVMSYFKSNYIGRYNPQDLLKLI